MERTRRDRSISILIGIGLVLVGLLAGILTMMFVTGSESTPVVMPKVVERVELGSRAEARPAFVSDSGGPTATFDIQSMNLMFKEVAQKVTPAVVYIQVEVPAPREWFQNFEGRDGQERFFRPRQSVGSGVIISEQGYIVTNNHVVEGAEDIEVMLSDKRQFGATVVGIDSSTDLAVIKIKEGTDLPVVALGDSDELEVGEWVLAVGNPFRLTSTVTAGIVSALGRQVNIIEDTFRIEDFIQTDAAINPGNSGGGLVNLHGELVGISTAIATESGSYEGYGFAVPVNLVKRVASDLIAYGEVQRGLLGVTIQDVDARRADELGLEHVEGVYITEARRGGAAHRAGVRGGDVVLAIDGQHVDAANELQSVVALHRPGDQVSVEVWRDGQRKAFQVELLGRDSPVYQEWISELRPQPSPEPVPEAPEEDVFELGDWGVGLRELSERERDAFEVQEGVYVAYVERGSAAHQAGLPRDVVIVDVAGGAVTSIEDALRLVAEAADTEEAVLIRVQRRDGLAAFYEVAVPHER